VCSSDLAFLRAAPTDGVQPVSFSCSLVATSRGDQVPRLEASVAPADLRFAGGSVESNKIPIFRDIFLEYEAMNLNVAVPRGRAIKGVVLWTRLGANDHTSFRVYFRCVYCAFQLAALYYMFRRFGVAGWRSSTIEQQLTLPLLVIAVIANSPLCIVQVGRPRYFPFCSSRLRPHFFTDTLTSAYW
jgi:hypothetical protein